MFAIALASLAYDNGAPHSRLPPLGWSSWVALGPNGHHPIFDFCDEATVMRSIDALHAVGMFEAGYRHFHLDDCWAGGRNESGSLFAQRDTFPRGLAPVIEYAHAKGLTFGLYTCAGTQTCVGGRPGSKGHWDADAAVFAEWGVDWVKMDWCNTEGMEPRHAYAQMSAALNRTGRPMHLNMCEWGLQKPWEWGGKVAQSWRMSQDHVGRWNHTHIGPKFVDNLGTMQVIRQSAAIPAANTGVPYGWNDMDLLETGNYEQAAHANGVISQMTATEYQTEFVMWAISASPLVVTTPLVNCTPASGAAPVKCFPWISELQKRILLNTEVLAINQDTTPQGRPVVEGANAVWARALSDGSAAVALYNEGEAPLSLAIDFAALGWPADATATVRDLLGHADLGTYKGRYPRSGGAEVAPHDVRLLRITPT